MLFNSLAYGCFLPVVVTGFFLIPQKFRGTWLLAASYYFYGYQAPEYLVLLLISTLVAYVAAVGISKTQNRLVRLSWLLASIATDVGILFSFKYFPFFKTIVDLVFQHTGSLYDAPAARLFLPAGISFYTFQNLSYVFDVYRGRMDAQRRFGSYALFVTFFPQLIAGPIERAPALLPQLERRHFFDHGRVADGLKIILFGLFEKVLLADRFGALADPVYVFPQAARLDGLDMVLATYFFAFQIYFDFAGYSHIAIGSAKILGIELVDNFRHPYSAHDIGEFWRRWHISLMSWLRDYIYFPLGGNRASFSRWTFNIFLIFLVSGLWHGANWTFLVWGALHAAYIWLSRLTRALREQFVRWARFDRIPTIHAAIRRLIVFNAVCLGWVFFRAQSLRDAIAVLKKICHIQLRDFGQLSFDGWKLAIALGLFACFGVIARLQGRESPRHFLSDRPTWLRWGICYFMIVALIVFHPRQSHAFIYFQF